MRTVGYYVHHVGTGHVRRATSLAAALAGRGVEVVGLSTLPRPEAWTGGWQQLPPDEVDVPTDPTARGRLHWAPRDHPRSRSRAAAVSRWIDAAAPDLLVTDVSVEAGLLARLHGVPTVAVALPGDREDAAHQLGFDVADAVVGFWPESVTDHVLSAAPSVRARVVALGGHSSLPVAGPDAGARCPQRVVALSGRGGAAWGSDQLQRVRTATEADGWHWTVLGEGTWVENPRDALERASVVVTHAGQNAIADVAALRRPAVVVPAERPHREQWHTGAALAGGDWPVSVLDDLDRVPDRDWSDLLHDVSRLGGSSWSRWCDGRAAERFGDVVLGLLGRS